MIKYIPLSIRERLRKIDWLAKLYRKYLMKFPHDGKYLTIIDKQNWQMSKLSSQNKLLFSIVVPIYRPNLALFREMVDSVLSQTYSQWQLVLIDDASHSSRLSSYLSKLDKNEKIIVITQEKNGHISQASNAGLSKAIGDFIVLLDHDDVLHHLALQTAANFIENHPEVDILYSDEDKIDEFGNRYNPHFKPQYNLDLLLSHNYISHLGIYRRTLIESIGGFRLGFEGSQDYDLLLRCVKKTKPQNIIHIPYVLYHWRAIEGSTALAEDQKGYAEKAGLKALESYLEATNAIVEQGKLANTYKVSWPQPIHKPLVSIIIPTKNEKELVQQCIESIYQKTMYDKFEILLINNNSDESEALTYFSELESKDKVRLIDYPYPFNYSAINNYAVTQAKGEYLVLMNNDIEIISHTWLTEMVAHLYRVNIGCVGAKLYYPDGKLQHGGVITGLGGVAGHSHKYFPKDHPGYFKRLQVTQNLSAVTAACLGVRKDVFEQVGGLNEQHLAIAFNDVDFCLRVQQAGYHNLWSPYIEMTHHESASRGREDTPEKQERFIKEVNYMKNRWGQQLSKDPHYSLWLALDREDFTYR